MVVERLSFPKTVAVLFRSRVEAIFVWSWVTTIICLVLGRGFPPLGPTLLTILSMIFLSASTYLYNDVIDMDMDALNEAKGKRPLPSKKVTVGEAMKVIYLLGFLGLGIMLTVNLPSFFFALLYVLILIGYSHPKIRFKKRFILNEAFHFLCFPTVGLMVGYALAGRVVPQALFASIIVGCYATPMKPLFGDATDMHEDKLFGMKHLGVVLSWKGKIQLMTAAVLFIMTVTPLTYVQLGFNMLLPILIVGLSLVFLRFMFPIINHYDKVPYLKARKFAMGYFILLNVLLLIGTLDLPFFK